MVEILNIFISIYRRTARFTHICNNTHIHFEKCTSLHKIVRRNTPLVGVYGAFMRCLFRNYFATTFDLYMSIGSGTCDTR